MKIKKLISTSIVSLLVFVFPFALFAQVEEVNRLNDFVGDYTYSVLIEQPGIKSIKFGKAKIQLTDTNAINSEFANHKIEFVIEYSPEKNSYLFTYIFKEYSFINSTTKTLLSIDKVELVYTEDEGYTCKENDEEKNWNLEVTIKVEEDKFTCNINSTFEENTFKHILNLWK